MAYATSDAIWAMPPWLTFYLFKAMNEFSYHILLIIHVYNAGTSQLRSYTQLRLYARLRLHFLTSVDVMTSVVSPNSDHAS
jgi:hypothetical protein